MATKKNKAPVALSLDKRIKKVLDESWIAPTYIFAGIVELLNKVNAMDDDELAKYMEGMIHPTNARAHIQELYERLK